MNYLLIAVATTYVYLVLKTVPSAWKIVVRLNERGYFPPPPVKHIQWMSYFLPFLFFMFFYMITGIFVDFLIKIITLNLFRPAYTDEELELFVDKMMEGEE